MSEAKSAGMVTIVQNYVSRMINIPGMKAMLLDKYTSGIVGLVYSMTEIISHEVFDLEILKPEEKQGNGVDLQEQAVQQHLKAVVFVRPTHASLQLVQNLLRRPKYKEYHLFFSNILTEEQLKLIAQADEQSLVREVQEFYADINVLESCLFALDIPDTRGLAEGKGASSPMQKTINGIISCLLAHKKRPMIRYPAGSEICREIATAVQDTITRERELFYFQQRSQPLLLILDRRDDPLTPLLSQWTYQAMVHDLLGISKNRINLKAVPDISPDLMEVVLAPHQDDFFREAMYLNFGELGTKLKELVASFQRKKNSTANVNSIEDMQRFVDAFPEFKRQSGNVSKHVSLTSEIARQVGERRLMEVSEVEQEIACQDDHSQHLNMALSIMNNPAVKFFEKLRLVLIYTIRYETYRNDIEQLVKILTDRASNQEEKHMISAVNLLIRYAGQSARGGNLFESKSFFSKLKSTLNTGLQGVQNVYTQHKPLLTRILDQVGEGKLTASSFPFVDSSGNARTKPDQVFVFIVGGCTYSESAIIANLNNTPGLGIQFILGGTTVHSAHSFVKSLVGEDRSRRESDDIIIQI
jgi:vacuolar protein sorting-associated protein 45